MAIDPSAERRSARADFGSDGYDDEYDRAERQSMDSMEDASADEYGDWNDEDETEWQEANYSRLRPDDRQLGQILGWFSIGLGLAGMLAPRAVGRTIGVGDHPGLLRALGAREIASGLGLLSERMPGAWAWSRVAGDAMDLALLGAAARLPDADPRRLAVTTAGVLAVTALDVYAGRRLQASQSADAPQIAVTESVTIDASPGELYQFWKNLENLPLFMDHLESVSRANDRTSHWVARAPAGASVEWDAEIVDDRPDRRIGWRTLPGSQVTHEGMVSFEPAPGGRGTVVRIEMLYCPPAGKVGMQIARLFGEEPGLQINDDLRHLKQLLETGEVATTLGQPSGRRSMFGRATLGRRMQ